MSTELANRNDNAATVIESVLIGGDLEKLTPEQRVQYYNNVCESLGLNPLTQPFAYIKLNGKLTLYAKKDATDQLRMGRKVSIQIVGRDRVGEAYIVTARATTPDGRTDESTGVVSIGNLKGDALANAYMKAETKAKRRVTLSICGLGVLDESEADSIPEARIYPAESGQPARITGGESQDDAPTAGSIRAQIEALAKLTGKTKQAIGAEISEKYDVHGSLDSWTDEDRQAVAEWLDWKLTLGVDA